MSLGDAIHSGIGQPVVHGFHAVTNHRPPIYGVLGAHPGWSVHEADADGHVATPLPAPAAAPHRRNARTASDAMRAMSCAAPNGIPRSPPRRRARAAGGSSPPCSRRLPNGTYSVYAAFDRSSVNDRIVYQGVAEVERPPKAKPGRPLLPDLVVRPQRNPTFETPFLDFFEPVPPPGESCYPSEAAEEGAETCLRFDSLFANVGEGPLEMRFAIPRDPASDARTIRQRIYRSDGAIEERSAGEWEFHNAHGHFHYTGFGVSRLWATDGAGARVGPEPVRTGDKVSFCIIDTDLEAFGVKGNGPRTYHATDCLAPTESNAENDYLVQGITPGWGDLYDWFLPDQYIEVTGVPDGVYLLETDNTILEANESNNCGSVYVRLSNVASSPTAELLGPGLPC